MTARVLHLDAPIRRQGVIAGEIQPAALGAARQAGSDGRGVAVWAFSWLRWVRLDRLTPTCMKRCQATPRWLQGCCNWWPSSCSGEWLFGFPPGGANWQRLHQDSCRDGAAGHYLEGVVWASTWLHWKKRTAVCLELYQILYRDSRREGADGFYLEVAMWTSCWLHWNKLMASCMELYQVSCW